MKKDGRVYVCHTYYHVFVSCLKEFNLPKEEQEKADLVLSLMSTDFETFSERIGESGIFKNVYSYDEKREDYFPELTKWKKNRGNIVANMFSRIVFTKKFGKLQSEFVPVDFKKYKDVYVFCDADPIGCYLNCKRIHYHSVEDGLDTLKPFVPALSDNAGSFGIKKFMSMKLNLIFIRDGYSKYCTDMEVNDKSVIDDEFYKYKEVPRNELIDALDEDEKKRIIKAFVRDYDSLERIMSDINKDKKNIIILTEPLTTLDMRERLVRDLVNEYSKEGTVFLKPHPRDELDYDTLFADCFRFDRTVPMEILNFFEKTRFDKVVSVYTQLGSVRFAKEKVMLGNEFMDKYEDPSIHQKIKKL